MKLQLTPFNHFDHQLLDENGFVFEPNVAYIIGIERYENALNSSYALYLLFHYKISVDGSIYFRV